MCVCVWAGVRACVYGACGVFVLFVCVCVCVCVYVRMYVFTKNTCAINTRVLKAVLIQVGSERTQHIQ